MRPLSTPQRHLGPRVSAALPAAHASSRLRPHPLFRFSSQSAARRTLAALPATAEHQPAYAFSHTASHTGWSSSCLDLFPLRRPGGCHPEAHRPADPLGVYRAGRLCRHFLISVHPRPYERVFRRAHSTCVSRPDAGAQTPRNRTANTQLTPFRFARNFPSVGICRLGWQNARAQGAKVDSKPITRRLRRRRQRPLSNALIESAPALPVRALPWVFLPGHFR